MNALRDLFYVLSGTVVFGLIFLGMGHCQTISAIQGEVVGGNTVWYGDVLPDAPSTSKAKWHLLQPEPVPEHVGFWTVGRWDSPKPLRSNKEVWKSKSFWLEELALYGSTFAEMDVARGGRQNPPVPRGRDLWVDAFAPIPVITFFHVLGRKYICQCIGDGAVMGATAWNLYAAGKQYYH